MSAWSLGPEISADSSSPAGIRLTPDDPDSIKIPFISPSVWTYRRSFFCVIM